MLTCSTSSIISILNKIQIIAPDEIYDVFPAWKLCSCANWAFFSTLDPISSSFPHTPYLAAYGVCDQNRFIFEPHSTFIKRIELKRLREEERTQNPFWGVLLQSTVLSAPPTFQSSQWVSGCKGWAEPRPRRRSQRPRRCVAPSRGEDRLLGFVWWTWMSSITSFRDVDGY